MQALNLKSICIVDVLPQFLHYSWS